MNCLELPNYFGGDDLTVDMKDNVAIHYSELHTYCDDSNGKKQHTIFKGYSLLPISALVLQKGPICGPAMVHKFWW